MDVFTFQTLVSMSSEQCKESISLSQLNLIDGEEKVKPYTLEEFSYDHFRYTASMPFLHAIRLQTGWGDINSFLFMFRGTILSGIW